MGAWARRPTTQYHDVEEKAFPVERLTYIAFSHESKTNQFERYLNPDPEEHLQINGCGVECFLDPYHG